MSVKRNSTQKKKLTDRIKRIQGQLNKAVVMIQDDAECIDIMRLLNSSTGAMRGLWTQILNEHLKHCVSNAMQQKDDKVVDELIDYLKTLR